MDSNQGKFSVNVSARLLWHGANFNAASGRSTPSYIDGKIITVAGARCHLYQARESSGLGGFLMPCLDV